MKKKILWTIFALCLTGSAVGAIVLNSGAAVTDGNTVVSDGNVIITNGKTDAGPEFERIYTATLPGDRTLEIRLHTNYHYGWHTPQRENRFSKLIQSNGYYILFDPTRVADKVIDPSLADLVESISTRVLATDAAWWADKPKEFTDAGGTTWVRK